MPIIASWNLHPGEGRWISCHIWDNAEEMREATELGEPTYEGCWVGNLWYLRDDELITRKLGEIHLVDGCFGVGVVAHEIQHFLSCWQDFKGWEIIGKNFEDIAYLAQKLTNDFWNRFYEVFEN